MDSKCTKSMPITAKVRATCQFSLISMTNLSVMLYSYLWHFLILSYLFHLGLQQKIHKEESKERINRNLKKE